MTTFESLTPDRFLPCLEEALTTRLTALTRPLPSYINRVYELRSTDDTARIVKFYRPGRWTVEAIAAEHEFLFDCRESDIPVVCPLLTATGNSVGSLEGIPFAVFPKRAGRQFDVETPESWSRIGMLLGRLHTVGAKRSAPSRLTLTPQTTTQRFVDSLLEHHVADRWRDSYQRCCGRIIETISPLFEGITHQRIHGDFHSGNILHRPGEGLMVIDFDDMMNGPVVQDFWLLLPEHYPASRSYLDTMMRGYAQFCDVDTAWFSLIEPLRAMRLIYFTAWCAMQKSDSRFQKNFPDWGSDSFWASEVRDLEAQYRNILDTMENFR